MKHFRRFLDFLLFSNLFIALCAGSMVVETCLLLDTEINWLYAVFVFCSSTVLYNYPGLFLAGGLLQSERQRWIRENTTRIRSLFFIALAAAGTLLFFLPLKLILGFIPVTILSFAYFLPATNLRAIPVVKTVVVALVWTCITHYFPLMLSPLSFGSGEAGEVRFFFLLALAIAFNIRDIEVDRGSGVHTFPVIFGIQKTKIVCLLSLLVSSLLAVIVYDDTAVKAVMIVSCTVTAVGIGFAAEKKSEYYYSLWMDGMILLQALLLVACRL